MRKTLKSILAFIVDARYLAVRIHRIIRKRTAMHEDSTHSMVTRYSVGLSAVYDDGVWTSSSHSPACL